MTHLSFTAMKQSPLFCEIPMTDPSPGATACRSRRGVAPEGSSLFRPGVEARSAEDPGKRRRIQGIRPRQGVAHTSQSTSATPYGVAGSLAMPDPRVFGATPLDPGLKSGHPCRGATRRRFPSVPAQRCTPPGCHQTTISQCPSLAVHPCRGATDRRPVRLVR